MALDYMNVFWNLASGRETISLLNVYKGIPISYPATIINVGETAIELITEKHQLVCLYHERETHIQSPEIAEIIFAKVIGLDVPNLTAVLGQFEVVNKTIGERREVRVWPKFSIEGEVQTEELADTYQAEMADISRSGLGIYIRERDYFPRVYCNGRKLVVSFKLPGVYQIYEPKSYDYSSSSQAVNAPRYDRSSMRFSTIHQPKSNPENTQIRRLASPEITVQGVIANIMALENQHRYRVGIRLYPNEFAQLIITQFVSQRQSEIIQEINSVYQLISQG